MSAIARRWFGAAVALPLAIAVGFGCSSSGESGAGGGGDGTGTGGDGPGGDGTGTGGDGTGTGGDGTGTGGPVTSGTDCSGDGDCGPDFPYCDTGGTGECVQCLTDTNCGGSTCDDTTKTCAGGGPGGTGTTGGGTGLTGGPRFPGGGATAGFPLQPGFGPETSGDCPPPGGVSTTQTQQVRDNATLCFYGDDPSLPVATIEQVIEVVDGVEYIHLRVTFDPEFADNTYGTGSVGWSGKDGQREFSKLVGSDHVELLLTDCSGATVMQFKLDYINEDASAPSGYSAGGVTEGDGEMIEGDPAAVLAAATSIDRNLNGCGYSTYNVDSPATDENFTSNPDTPNWDYRVVYEVWLDAAAFDTCFGQAYIEFVHASPAKTPDDTIQVEGSPCPPDWDTPYCPETVTGEGSNCGTPTDGGPPDDGCPQNWTAFGDPNCPEECVPVPFAGYENRAPCPNGYVLDLASEGQYCVPESGEVCPP